MLLVYLQSCFNAHVRFIMQFVGKSKFQTTVFLIEGFGAKNVVAIVGI